MNFKQLEYIIAVENSRYFQMGFYSCIITQPKLRMMIQKLEVELGTVIFDRSKQPVIPTEAGKEMEKVKKSNKQILTNSS